jgi:Uncharacterized conserved protein, contains double-stranded beta-helix domain
MAVLRIPDQGRTLTATEDIVRHLSSIGIDYEVWEPAYPTTSDAPQEEILAAYSKEIDKLKARGATLPPMWSTSRRRLPASMPCWRNSAANICMKKTKCVHRSRPRGVSVHPPDAPVVAIEVEAGDLIRVPRGTWHWFDLCSDRQIRAIRLFQDPSGWTPVYTNSGEETKFEPVCFGPHSFLHDEGNSARHRRNNHTHFLRL